LGGRMPRTIVSMSVSWPVPPIGRAVTRRPPIVRGSSRIVSTAVVIDWPSAVCRQPSATTHKMDELDRIAVFYRGVGQTDASYDFAIMLDHNGAWVELQFFQQLEQRAASDLPGLSVDYDIHSR